jgi:hypothetical protein
MKLFTILALLFFSVQAICHTKSNRPSRSVEYLNMEFKRMPYQRDAMIPAQRHWDYELSLNFKSHFGGGLWLESDITGQTAYSRFRNLWWDYTIGFYIGCGVDLVWDHRSQHALDWDIEDYDVRDSFGIRFNFVK